MTLVIVTVKMRWKPGQTKTCRQMMSCFPVTVSWVTRERINVTVRLIPVRNGRGVFSSLPTCNLSSECEMVDMSDSSFQPSGPLPSSVWKQRACEMVEQ